MSRGKKGSAGAKSVPRAGQRGRGTAVGLIAVLAIVAAYIVIARSLRFTQDDAYISFRYARNLVEGQGLVFNPGERVEGYSNFAWTLLLALAIKLGAAPVAASQWLGILFGAGAVFLAARFARALEGRWGTASVGAAAFVAFNLAFVLWSTGGLETALFAFLVVLGLERGLAPGVGPKGRLAAPLVLALAALTRPEGPLVFALFFAVRALDTWRGGPCAHERGRAGLVRDALLFAAPLVPYAAWKLWYFGDLLPNPFYAKTGTTAVYLRRGVSYAGDFFQTYGLWGAAPIVAVLSIARGGLKSVEARLLAIWIAWAAYVVLIGGDVLYLHRFWLHFLPVGAVLLARGASWIGEGLLAPGSGAVPKPAPVRPWLAALLPLVLVAAFAASGVQRNLAATKERRRQENGFVDNMTQTGQWLKEHFAPHSTIAVTTIGAISYYSELRVIDMLGLTDREVAHNPKMIAGIADTWREIQYNAESVLRRRPDAILFSTGVRPSSAAEKALFFYAWFHRAYYPYYFRSKPWRESMQNCFRLRSDAPPFDPAFLHTNGTDWVDVYSDAHLAKSKERIDIKAIRLFRRCTELSPPEFRWPKEWLAVSLYDADSTDTALPLLGEIIRDDPYAEVARGRLADWEMRNNRFEEARKLFEEMLAIDPDDNLPWIALADLYRGEHEWAKALDYAKKGVQLWDTNPTHLLLLGTLAAHQGEYDLATWSLQRGLALRPGEDTATRLRSVLQLVDGMRAGRVKPPEDPPRGAGAGAGAGGAP